MHISIFQQLQKQANELARLQDNLETSQSQGGDGEEQQHLLEVIMQDVNKKKRTRRQSVTDISAQLKRLSFDGNLAGSSEETSERKYLCLWSVWLPKASWVHKTEQKQKMSLILVSAPLFLSAPDMVTAVALEMRRTLPVLHPGEEVLARWSDEGWYYRGTIKHDCGDGSYFVQDSVGDLDKIWREDILTDNDEADVVLQVKEIMAGSQINQMRSRICIKCTEQC